MFNIYFYVLNAFKVSYITSKGNDPEREAVKAQGCRTNSIFNIVLLFHTIPDFPGKFRSEFYFYHNTKNGGISK